MKLIIILKSVTLHTLDENSRSVDSMGGGGQENKMTWKYESVDSRRSEYSEDKFVERIKINRNQKN